MHFCDLFLGLKLLAGLWQGMDWITERRMLSTVLTRPLP